MISLVAQNRQDIIPLIVPALEKNSQSHWNQAVLNLTMNVRKMLSEMDDELFLACQRKFKEEEEKRMAVEEKRKMTWERLETAAAFQPVTGNTAVLVRSVMAPAIASSLA